MSGEKVYHKIYYNVKSFYPQYTVHKLIQIASIGCLELLLLVIEMKAEPIFEKFIKRKLIIN